MDSTLLVNASRAAQYSLSFETILSVDTMGIEVSVDFTILAASQTGWSWADVATSISHYYDGYSQWTPCAVVNSVLGRNDCCDTPIPTACLVARDLESALNATGNFASKTGANEPGVLAQIISELQAGRPVCARVEGGGLSEFVVISAYYEVTSGPEGQHFDIWDPLYDINSTVYLLSHFRNYYGDGTGTWTHTYFTQA